ncbi:zinc finger BED domain-containing protein 5-like [Pseudochaenichthys georgianus]|uniref:zinc finger BED domain-containing protein 5-like n=1 Tax=Pseudochaenichthys georgianus TaxID=52239 RepID=UPI0039C364B0
MVAVLEELATDKSMDRIVASLKQVPLSASTTARRVHVLAEDVQRLVLDEVKKAEHISVAIDESTDTTDISQLSVFVRYFDEKDFKEELLALIPLEGNTEIIFEKVEELFKKHGLLLQKVNLIVTDGAPAMVGKNRGMVSRFKNVAPKTNALHCLIHQSVLYAKLSGDLKDVMDKTMKIINFIRGNSSTQHRLFRKFVLESDATHDDLLLHNEVHWLSKGKAFEPFIELRDQVVEFVKQSKSKGAADYLCIMRDKTYMSNVVFLADIFSHLNALNLQLQGKEKSVVNLVEKLDAFRRKLDLFNTDLISGKLLHFNTLKTVGESNVTRNMKQFMTQLRENFSTRFDDFAITRDVLEFVRDPFSISLVGEFSANAKKLLQLDEAAIQIQLIDMQASSEMQAALRGAESLSTFWVSCPQDYGTLKTLAMYVLTMFGSTYTCESGFSK